MEIINALKKKVEKPSAETTFILSNNIGGFAWIDSEEAKSRYQGVFFSESSPMKAIESIKDFEPEKVLNKFWQVEKYKTNMKASFFMPDKLNSFVYETNSNSAEICLDIKPIYENDYSHYEVEESSNLILVNAYYKSKYYYLAIRYNGIFSPSKTSLEHFYQYDHNRNSFPFKRNVFLLGSIKSNQIVFSFSEEKEKALSESLEVYNKVNEFKENKKIKIMSLVKNIKADKKINMAYNSCKESLQKLISGKRLYAGFPWFFQFWARDELISLKALSNIDKEAAQTILENWAEKLNGFSLPSKENEALLSLDAVGWLIKRISDLKPELLDKENIKNFLLNLDGNLQPNGKGETWMDSISRDGFRIEIQATKLYMLSIAYELTNDKKFKDYQKELKEKIFDEFWLKDILSDSSSEREIRPNLFIAYYFFPKLLKKSQWETCFKTALDSLWCEWGGLSTLDKNNLFFKDRHSGEFGSSYHQGDSWFWINNLAALCMINLNAEKFSKYIKKIVNASTNEILFSGALGNHAELSSSSELKSEGAVAQAFSAAMYIEMIEEFIKKF